MAKIVAGVKDNLHSTITLYVDCHVTLILMDEYYSFHYSENGYLLESW
jgi:hypothetical protein